MTAFFSAMTSALSPALLWGWPPAHAHDPQQLHGQTATLNHVTTVTITDEADVPTIIAQPQLLKMAPVQLEPEFSYGPALKAGCHVLGAAYLTFEVGRSLYRAQRGLGPAQDTRERSARRHALIPIFATLAGLSLLRAAYTAIQYATLSYKVWASQHDVEVPARFYGDRGAFPPGDKAIPLYLFQWLSDTPVYLDAIEILAEKARRFWWGQQIDLSLISWTMLLAIEGRRRNIPLLWCYQLLGQLVSLSFAQNLFFIALLLTPSPLPIENGSLPVSRYVEIRNRIFPPKPTNWRPHPFFFTGVLALNFCIISLIPFFVNTPAVQTLVLVSRILSFTPLVLSYIVPTSWGVRDVHHHKAYKSHERLFRFISAASFFLQTRALFVGLAYNAPDAHYHRHAIHLPFDVEQRSAWERTTSAFGRILSATKDHPIVSGVGWDVLLSVLSIGCWAAVRATNASDILASTIPSIKGQRRSEDGKNLEVPDIVTQVKEAALDAIGAKTDSQEVSGPRRRGRPRKVKPESDETYEPTPSEMAETEVGDVLPDTGLEWESAAVVWGLTAVGGLGVGSAGAFGGECVAR